MQLRHSAEVEAWLRAAAAFARARVCMCVSAHECREDGCSGSQVRHAPRWRSGGGRVRDVERVFFLKSNELQLQLQLHPKKNELRQKKSNRPPHDLRPRQRPLHVARLLAPRIGRRRNGPRPSARKGVAVGRARACARSFLVGHDARAAAGAFRVRGGTCAACASSIRPSCSQPLVRHHLRAVPFRTRRPQSMPRTRRPKTLPPTQVCNKLRSMLRSWCQAQKSQQPCCRVRRRVPFRQRSAQRPSPWHRRPQSEH